MSRRSRYSPEVRERAVRMVLEHEREYSSQWAAITSIAEKVGCAGARFKTQSEQDFTLCLLSLQGLEGWLKGDPEGELHILGPVSQWDMPTMMSSC